MKKSRIRLLCLIILAAALSLASCQKDNVKKLSGTRWKSEDITRPLILEFLSDTDVRFYLPDEDNHIKEGLKEGSYSIVEGEIIFEENAIFFVDKVTATTMDVTHYFQTGKLEKGKLRITAKTITVEYNLLDRGIVKSTRTSESHYSFKRL